MGKLRQKLKKFAIETLDLPKDLILNMPRITTIGFYQVYIENYKGVIQFNDKYLHLKVSNKEVKIMGEKLVIRKIWPEEILVEGIIKEILYLD